MQRRSWKTKIMSADMMKPLVYFVHVYGQFGSIFLLHLAPCRAPVFFVATDIMKEEACGLRRRKAIHFFFSLVLLEIETGNDAVVKHLHAVVELCNGWASTQSCNGRQVGRVHSSHVISRNARAHSFECQLVKLRVVVRRTSGVMSPWNSVSRKFGVLGLFPNANVG